ncbi:MAG: DUF6049 family protein [Glaciihabitans sp.]
MTARPTGAVVALVLGLLGIGAALPPSSADLAPAAPLTAAASVATASGDVPADEAPAGAITMTVAPDTLGIPAAGEALYLTVTVTNGTSTAIDGATVEADVNPAQLTDSDTLTAWLTDAEDSIDAPRAVSSAQTSAIAAGETRIVGVTVPQEALAFTTEGVYALGVRLLSGGEEVAHARTALSWKGSSTNPVSIAVAAPLVLPATTAGLIDAATLAEYTARGGILSDQLDAMLGTPVAIGIDPRILVSIRVLGTAAPQSALEWLDRLRVAANPTFPLPYADADLAVSLAAGAAAPPAPTSFDFAVDPTQFAPVETASPSPTAPPTDADPALPPFPSTESLTEWDYSYPDLVWPAADTVTAATFPTLAASGSPVLLSSDNVERSRAAGTSAVTSTIDGAAVAVADSRLSTLVQSAVNAGTTADWTAAMAELSSSTALAGDQTGAPSTVLVTLDRSWSDAGYRLEQTLSTLYGLPWATPTGVDAALNTSSLAPDPATLIEGSIPQERVDTTAALLAAESAEASFVTIAADPSALIAERRLELLSLLSNAWLDDPDGWSERSAEFLAESEDVLGAIQISPSSTIQLPSDRGALPVTVNNGLDQEVTVYVNLRSRTPVLSVEDEYVELVIEPLSSARAQIPVVSLSNGEVRLSATVYDQPGGNSLGETSTIELNVHAGWETAGTVIFGALVVLIFVIGIVRTVRKRRRAARTPE